MTLNPHKFHMASNATPTLLDVLTQVDEMAYACDAKMTLAMASTCRTGRNWSAQALRDPVWYRRELDALEAPENGTAWTRATTAVYAMRLHALMRERAVNHEALRVEQEALYTRFRRLEDMPAPVKPPRPAPPPQIRCCRAPFRR